MNLVRRAALFLVVCVAAAVSLTWSGTAAAAQYEDAPPTSEAVTPLPVPHIVPRPNSGAEPKSATDPGGAAQYAVMGAIVLGLVVIVLLVARESRKKKPKTPTSS
jgi:hypothetical protein